jgi:hypothetical protein
MNSLSIRRLSAEVSGSEPEARVRVDRLLHRLADSTLDEQGAGWHGLTGHWCVRHLRLLVELDETETDVSLARRWADAIAACVRELVPDGTRVVHYPNRAHAVHDLVDSLPQRVAEHRWAWRQLGLLAEQDPNPEEQPDQVLVAVARREPALVLASLAQVALRGRLPALHRVLGEAGWVALAGAVEGGSGTWRADPRPADLPPAWHGVDPWAAPEMTPPRLAPEVRARAEAVLADSKVARAVIGSGIVASEATIVAWAALSVAEVDPHGPALRRAVSHLLRRRLLSPVALALPDVEQSEARPPLHEVVAAPDGALIPRPGGTAPAEVGEATQAGPSDAIEPQLVPAPEAERPVGDSVDRTSIPATIAEDPSRTLDRPVADPASEPEEEAYREGRATEWAGLLFLLNTADLAEIPDDLDVDPRLAARSLRWSLHQLAQRLVPVMPTDPAALALAGLVADRDRTAVPFGDPPTAQEDMALAEHADRWAEQTRIVLLASVAAAGAGGPAPTLWSVTRRPGRIVADPGWLEVHLDLDTVDVHVRRAGLDVDLGWVPWLGTVVRFRYV